MVLALTLKFILWEAAMWMAALRIARWIGWRDGVEKWLGVLAIEITLESSVAAILSFAGWNGQAAYWAVAVVCIAVSVRAAREWSLKPIPFPRTWAAIAALATPLLILGFRPVEEIDSINYLHYLLDWMANRATPYTFATNYVAFWELSFLPAWTFTGLDVFFPLLAVKAVVLMGLALWLIGREIGLDGRLLLWAIFGALTMRYYWFQFSGVPTLKNDALHGIGFVLLTVVVVRAARRNLETTDIALLAFGVSFASVKYTGIFLAGIAVVFLIVRGIRGLRVWLPVTGLFLVTSGHYYVRSVIQHGSPFYPFQINLGPIHLPGTADLSYSSILYNLHDPRLWRALFLPADGVSHAGLLFPEILAGALLTATWRCGRAVLRRKAAPLDWTAAALLCGWFLYFRSVYSACAGPGDLSFLLNGLNSIRYVDGVLAVSELFLAACLGMRLAIPLIAVNTASRLVMLYVKLNPQIYVIAGVVLLAFWFLARTRWVVAAATTALLLACPFAVERNRANSTAQWNSLKPALDQARHDGLVLLALEDGGYFAGHVAAAGNPVDPRVRAVLPEEFDALPPPDRPKFLAVLVMPGSEIGEHWRKRYGDRISSWGYSPQATSSLGGVFRNMR